MLAISANWSAVGALCAVALVGTSTARVMIKPLRSRRQALREEVIAAAAAVVAKRDQSVVARVATLEITSTTVLEVLQGTEGDWAHPKELGLVKTVDRLVTTVDEMAKDVKAIRNGS